MKYTTLAISPTFMRLLTYIVKYSKLRGRASRGSIIERLILAYANQLASGMPEPVWRDNMITLINECHQEHQEKWKNEVKAHKKLEKKASS